MKINFFLFFTGNDSCTSGFISSDDIKEPATNITSVIPASTNQNALVLFKDIKIKCNGTIKSVIIGAKLYPDRTHFPLLQLWHYGNYSAPYLEIELNNSYMDIDGVSWYNVSQPIVISSADELLLGIYQPNCNNAEICIYYQQFNGPENYQRTDNNELQILNRNHYPLISILFGKFCYNYNQPIYYHALINFITRTRYTICSIKYFVHCNRYNINYMIIKNVIK